MIHYTCDCCKRTMGADDFRYVVKMEVYAALERNDSDDDDCDHLQEVQDILERMDDAADDAIGDDVYQQLRFDMCPECRAKFVGNPLGREAAHDKLFDFSNN